VIDTDKLDWTNELPQREGYYFCRNSVILEIEEIIEVYRGSGQLEKLRIRESGRKLSKLERYWEFAGPLEDLIDLRS
jgi:hypothetical protein